MPHRTRCGGHIPLLARLCRLLPSGRKKLGGVRGGLHSALPLATAGTQEQSLVLRGGLRTALHLFSRKGYRHGYCKGNS